jgi:Uncharacterised nucleotidyltransferase
VRGRPRGRGQLVARALRGSWRTSPPPPELSTVELESIAPLLIRTGSAGLAWRVIRQDRQLADSRSGQRLWAAWLLEVGRETAQRQHLLAVLKRTSSAGLDPVLIKGWSVARRYPGPGLRPSCDVDLCLPPAQVARARRLVGDMAVAVDLDHHHELEGTPIDGLFDRSVVVELAGQPVRVPAPSDELRMLCLHFLKHGGWRPLWLCDIALICEQSPEVAALAASGVDRVGEYVSATIGSARRLLDADCAIDPPPPEWMVSTIQREWGSWATSHARGPLAPVWPLGRFVNDLPGRVPNAVAATVATGAPVARLPRALVQMVALAESRRSHVGDDDDS